MDMKPLHVTSHEAIATARSVLAGPNGQIAKAERLQGVILDLVAERIVRRPDDLTPAILNRARRIKRDFDLAMVQALSIINPALREMTLGLGQAIAGHAALVD